MLGTVNEEGACALQKRSSLIQRWDLLAEITATKGRIPTIQASAIVDDARTLIGTPRGEEGAMIAAVADGSNPRSISKDNDPPVVA